MRIKKIQYKLAIPIFMLIGCFGFVNFSSAEEIEQVYVSKIFDLNSSDYNIDKIKWSKSGEGVISIQVRAGHTDTYIANNDWKSVLNNTKLDIDNINNKQYIQYKATFKVDYSESYPDKNLSLDSLVIEYSDTDYPKDQYIESSIFDTGADNAIISSISWKESNASVGSSITAYMRTSENSNSMGDWNEVTYCDKTNDINKCDVSRIFENNNNKFLQYKLYFNTSSNGSVEIDDLTIDYESNTVTPLLNGISISIVDLYESSGVYVSSVYDTKANNGLKDITIDQVLNDGSVAIAVKSCSKDDCSDEDDWSNCGVDNNSGITSSSCVDNGDRYLQYRLELKHSNDGDKTPEVEKVGINFNQPKYYEANTGFSVVAGITEDSAMSTEYPPIVQIIDSDGNQINAGYELFDDDTYGDGVANNNIYGTRQITVSDVGLYKIKIIAKNIFGLETKKVFGYFAIIE